MRAWALESAEAGMNVGQACISVLHESLSQTRLWVIERVEVDQWTFQETKVQVQGVQFCMGSA